MIRYGIGKPQKGDKMRRREDSSWANGPGKILRIATDVVGKRILDGLKPENTRDHLNVYQMLSPTVRKRVQKMTSSKLGEICGYATCWGYHHGGPIEHEDPPGFINFLGYTDMVRDEGKEMLLENGSFLVIMQEIATATLISIAIDITRQDLNREEWVRKQRE
jgi:hypothetical protein